MKQILFCLLYCTACSGGIPSNQQSMHKEEQSRANVASTTSDSLFIEKNNMQVTIMPDSDGYRITMAAPTHGWVAIGFNEKDEITGAYLIMGQVVNNTVHVVEYYTSAPGKYAPISTHNEAPSLKWCKGRESDNGTYIEFKVNTILHSEYIKPLIKGKQYYLIMAYSNEDDFTHHSAMRTSILIQL